MRRSLFTLAALLSLLLCVGMVVLWVRSYWTYEDLAINKYLEGVDNRDDPGFGDTFRYRMVSMTVGRGVCAVGYGVMHNPTRTPWFQHQSWFDPWFEGWSSSHPSGFAIEEWPRREKVVMFPLWLPVVLFAVMPVVWMIGRRGSPSNRCPTCSYSLTGNTSGICPECGSPVPTPAKPPETESPPA